MNATLQINIILASKGKLVFNPFFSPYVFRSKIPWFDLVISLFLIWIRTSSFFRKFAEWCWRWLWDQLSMEYFLCCICKCYWNWLHDLVRGVGWRPSFENLGNVLNILLADFDLGKVKIPSSLFHWLISFSILICKSNQYYFPCSFLAKMLQLGTLYLCTN